MKKMKTKNPYLLTILLSTSLLGMYVSQVTYFILATNGMNTANTIYNDKSTLTIQAKPPPSPPELDLRFYEDVACTKTITDIYFPFVGGGVVLGHKVNSSAFYIKAISNSKNNKKVYWSWSSSPPTGVILTLHSSILAKKTETMYIENTMYGLSAGEVIAVYWNVYVNTTATLGSFSWICTFSIYSSPNG